MTEQEAIAHIKNFLAQPRPPETPPTQINDLVRFVESEHGAKAPESVGVTLADAVWTLIVEGRVRPGAGRRYDANESLPFFHLTPAGEQWVSGD